MATCSGAWEVRANGIRLRCWGSSNPYSPVTALSRRRPAEHVSEKLAAAPQTFVIDRMADADRGCRLHRHTCFLQRGFGGSQRAVWNERVFGPVDQEYRGA